MRRALVIAFALLACAAGPTTRQDFNALLRDLSDADPTRRDAARDRLLAVSPDEFPALKAAAVACRPLSAAQFEAVHDGVLHAYLKTLPYEPDGNAGFLGITMVGTNPNQPFDTDPASPGIVVTERWPGYGAFESLRDGDVILRVTDKPEIVLTSQAAFLQTMQGRISGTTVGLDVLRSGSVIHVDVRLSARPKRTDGEQNFRLSQMSRVALANAFFAKEFAEIATAEPTLPQ